MYSQATSGNLKLKKIYKIIVFLASKMSKSGISKKGYGTVVIQRREKRDN